MAAAAAAAARRGRGSASGGGVVLLCLVAAALLMEAIPAAEAGGKTYYVGDAAGWGRNLDWWLAGKTFYAGDVLVFKYNKEYHDVAVVGGKGYRRCKVPRNKDTVVLRTGYDQVTLRRGNNYFICGMPGHCDAGMKLAVKAW
ncbi:basic blue protein-like [Oryza glaberrima]|uniref:Plantacyanin n=1 Tax=Oryza glaberrima TaxID=4538 RepID=I1Q1F1_ORYGL|nr:basic blue protein-like [Oryza glaberrima]